VWKRRWSHPRGVEDAIGCSADECSDHRSVHEPPAASTTTAGNDPEPWLADDPNDGEDMCQGDMSAGFDVSSDKPAFFCTACQGSSACGIVASRRADAYWSLQAQLCQSGRHMTRRAYNRGFQCHACRVQSPADDLPLCPSR
jgi:hypothetical protein